MSEQPKDGGPAFPVCPGQDDPTTTRFLSYVPVSDIADCWEWRGGRTEKGYGVFALSHEKQVRAHRFSWQIYTGRAASGLVLHACDNPSCVNPLHLSDGTHTENMRQMASRKRAVRADRHHKAKITTIEAIAINLLHRSGNHSTRDIAAMFGMSQPTIAAIVKGDLWPDAHSTADAMLAARGAAADYVERKVK